MSREAEFILRGMRGGDIVDEEIQDTDDYKGDPANLAIYHGVGGGTRADGRREAQRRERERREIARARAEFNARVEQRSREARISTDQARVLITREDSEKRAEAQRRANHEAMAARTRAEQEEHTRHWVEKAKRPVRPPKPGSAPAMGEDRGTAKALAYYFGGNAALQEIQEADRAAEEREDGMDRLAARLLAEIRAEMGRTP
ncbi:hypothetical protein ACWCRF_07260 [Streptomyces sp. NPDC002405]